MLIIVLAASPALRVETAGDLPCDLASRLKPAMQELRVEVDERAAHRLVVAQVGGALVVRLIDTANRELGWRTLRPSARDCAVLPRTLVLLARTWLSARFPDLREAGPTASPTPIDPLPIAAEPPDAGKPPPPVRTVEPPPPVRTVEPPPPVREVEPQPPVETAPIPRTDPVPVQPAPLDAEPLDAEPIDAGAADGGPLDVDAGTPDFGGLDGGPLRPAATTVALDAAAPTPFAVAALAGISLDLARPTAQVTALVDWAFADPWGAALELGFDTPRTLATGPGTITLQAYFVGLSAKRSFFDRLHVTVGARLFLLPVGSQGFTTDESRLLVSGAITATVDWRQPVYGRLFVIARIGGQARFRPEVITVPGAGSLILPVWSFFAVGGVGLKL